MATHGPTDMELAPVWFLHIPQEYDVRAVNTSAGPRFEVTKKAEGFLNKVFGMLPFGWGDDVSREWRPINLLSGGLLSQTQIANLPPVGDARAFFGVFRTLGWSVTTSGPLSATCTAEPIAPAGCTVTSGFVPRWSLKTLTMAPGNHRSRALVTDVPNLPFDAEQALLFYILLDVCHDKSVLIVFRTSAAPRTRAYALCYHFHPGAWLYYTDSQGLVTRRSVDTPAAAINELSLALCLDLEPVHTRELTATDNRPPVASDDGIQTVENDSPSTTPAVDPGAAYVAGTPVRRYASPSGTLCPAHNIEGEGIRHSCVRGSHYGPYLLVDGKRVANCAVLWPRNDGSEHYPYLLSPFPLDGLVVSGEAGPPPAGHYRMASWPSNLVSI